MSVRLGYVHEALVTVKQDLDREKIENHLGLYYLYEKHAQDSVGKRNGSQDNSDLTEHACLRLRLGSLKCINQQAFDSRRENLSILEIQSSRNKIILC